MSRFCFNWVFLLIVAVAPLHFTFASSETECESVETFAEYMFRYKILSAKDNAIQVREPEFISNLLDLERLWNDMKSQGIQSPLRARVCYASPYRVAPFRIVKDMVVEKSDDLYKDATSVRDYIDRSIHEIRQTLSNGYRAPSLTFEQTQTRKDLVERLTLKNERVRICGVTKDIEQHILERLNAYLSQNGLTPQITFFFGSRVMPRTEVIARDPLMEGVMPIADDGVMKNSVRISGLTTVSDLEIMIIFSAEKTLAFDSLKAIGKEFRRYLSESFREFSVSVKLVQIQQNDDLSDPFAFISVCRMKRPEYCDKPLSRYQFAPVQW